MRLEWQEDAPKNLMNWDEAIEYAKSLGDGWRLPTRGELCDAYDNFVDGFKKNYYWSSSTYAQFTNSAWSVYFFVGNVSLDGKTNLNYVRCVREIGE
jgi:hypothetical protein